MPVGKKWSLGIGVLPIEFCKVTLRVLEVLGVTRLQPPTTQAMEVDEIGNVVTREVKSSPAVTTVRDSIHHGAVRFFEMEGSASSKSTKRQ